MSSSPEVTAWASSGLCGQDGSSARVLGEVGSPGQPFRLPSRLSRMDESRTRAVGSLPRSQRGSSHPPGEANFPQCPQGPFLDAAIKPTLHVPLNPCPLQLGRKPNTPKPRALKVGCEGVWRKGDTLLTTTRAPSVGRVGAWPHGGSLSCPQRGRGWGWHTGRMPCLPGPTTESGTRGERHGQDRG